MSRPLRYTVLAPAFLRSRSGEGGKPPARTELVGLAVLNVADRFGRWTVRLASETAVAGEPQGKCLAWMAQHLEGATRLIGWRVEDEVAPRLVAAAMDCGSPVVAVTALTALARATEQPCVDLAHGHGGAAAPPFGALAPTLGIPVTPVTVAAVAGAHSACDHAAMRGLVEARAIALWLAYLRAGNGDDEATRVTLDWLAAQGSPWREWAGGAA